MSADRVDQFLSAPAEWAATQPAIRAVALVGSHARGAALETSDIDLVLLVQQPQQYLEDRGWTERFGAVRQQQVEPYGKVTSLRVWYADGLEVEYGLTDTSWAALPLDAGTERVISDGMRVILEREPLLSIHAGRRRSTRRYLRWACNLGNGLPGWRAGDGIGR
jgi:predicted nucleotidyltransferase